MTFGGVGFIVELTQLGKPMRKPTQFEDAIFDSLSKHYSAINNPLSHNIYSETAFRVMFVNFLDSTGEKLTDYFVQVNPTTCEYYMSSKKTLEFLTLVRAFRHQTKIGTKAATVNQLSVSPKAKPNAQPKLKSGSGLDLYPGFFCKKFTFVDKGVMMS